MLKDFRIKEGFTQEDIARLCNITLNHYQKIEYGKLTPNIKLGLLIAKKLKANPFDLWQV